MNWNDHLQVDETLIWEGKPAPRCYTLRNWPQSLFGLVLLLSGLVWFYLGINLETGPQSELYSWIPVPFVMAGLYLAIGHLLIARLEWESVYYAVSNRRVFVQRGLLKKTVSSLALKNIIWFSLKPFSATLGSVSILESGTGRKLTIACIEYPRQMTDLLEAAMVQSGAIPKSSQGSQQESCD
jgi:hypothetical protein